MAHEKIHLNQLKSVTTYKNLGGGGFGALFVIVLLGFFYYLVCTSYVSSVRFAHDLPSKIRKGELVHVSGFISGSELQDSETGYTFDAIALERVEERYGYYSYACGEDDESTCWDWFWKWNDSKSWEAGIVKLNGTPIVVELSMLSLYSEMEIETQPKQGFKVQLERYPSIHDGILYLTKNRGDSPELSEGDMRYIYNAIKPAEYSIIAEMKNGRFHILNKLGESYMDQGVLSIEQMIDRHKGMGFWEFFFYSFIFFIIFFVAFAMFWVVGVKKVELEGAEALVVLKSQGALQAIVFLLSWLSWF